MPVAVGLDCGGGGGALPADDRFLKPTFRDRQTALSSDHLVEEMQILADRLQTSCAVEEDGAGAEDAEAEADFSGPDGVPPSSAAAVLSYPPPRRRTVISFVGRCRDPCNRAMQSSQFFVGLALTYFSPRRRGLLTPRRTL